MSNIPVSLAIIDIRRHYELFLCIDLLIHPMKEGTSYIRSQFSAFEWWRWSKHSFVHGRKYGPWSWFGYLCLFHFLSSHSMFPCRIRPSRLPRLVCCRMNWSQLLSARSMRCLSKFFHQRYPHRMLPKSIRSPEMLEGFLETCEVADRFYVNASWRWSFRCSLHPHAWPTVTSQLG